MTLSHQIILSWLICPRIGVVSVLKFDFKDSQKQDYWSRDWANAGEEQLNAIATLSSLRENISSTFCDQLRSKEGAIVCTSKRA